MNWPKRRVLCGLQNLGAAWIVGGKAPRSVRSGKLGRSGAAPLQENGRKKKEGTMYRAPTTSRRAWALWEVQAKWCSNMRRVHAH